MTFLSVLSQSINPWALTALLSVFLLWLILELRSYKCFCRRRNKLNKIPYAKSNQLSMEAAIDFTRTLLKLSCEDIYNFIFYGFYGRDPQDVPEKKLRTWIRRLLQCDKANDYLPVEVFLAKARVALETCPSRLKKSVKPSCNGFTKGWRYGKAPFRVLYKPLIIASLIRAMHWMSRQYLKYALGYVEYPAVYKKNSMIHYYVYFPKKLEIRQGNWTRPVMFIPGFGFGVTVYSYYLSQLRSVAPNRILIVPEFRWLGIQTNGIKDLGNLPSLPHITDELRTFSLYVEHLISRHYCVLTGECLDPNGDMRRVHEGLKEALLRRFEIINPSRNDLVETMTSSDETEKDCSPANVSLRGDENFTVLEPTPRANNSGSFCAFGTTLGRGGYSLRGGCEVNSADENESHRGMYGSGNDGFESFRGDEEGTVTGESPISKAMNLENSSFVERLGRTHTDDEIETEETHERYSEVTRWDDGMSVKLGKKGDSYGSDCALSMISTNINAGGCDSLGSTMLSPLSPLSPNSPFFPFYSHTSLCESNETDFSLPSLEKESSIGASPFRTIQEGKHQQVHEGKRKMAELLQIVTSTCRKRGYRTKAGTRLTDSPSSCDGNETSNLALASLPQLNNSDDETLFDKLNFDPKYIKCSKTLALLKKTPWKRDPHQEFLPSGSCKRQNEGALGIDLLCHSYGSAVSSCFLMRHRKFVKKLCMMDSVCFLPQLTKKSQLVELSPTKIIFLEGIYLSTWTEIWEDQMTSLVQKVGRCFVSLFSYIKYVTMLFIYWFSVFSEFGTSWVTCRQLQGVEYVDRGAIVEDLRDSILLIFSEQDLLVPSEAASRLLSSEKSLSGKVLMIPQSGHGCCALSNVRKAVGEFLSK